VVTWLLRWLASLLAFDVLCSSACVPRLGNIDNPVGVAGLHPSLPPFFPLAFWPTRGLDA